MPAGNYTTGICVIRHAPDSINLLDFYQSRPYRFVICRHCAGSGCRGNQVKSCTLEQPSHILIDTCVSGPALLNRITHELECALIHTFKHPDIIRLPQRARCNLEYPVSAVYIVEAKCITIVDCGVSPNFCVQRKRRLIVLQLERIAYFQ